MGKISAWCFILQASCKITGITTKQFSRNHGGNRFLGIGNIKYYVESCYRRGD